MKTQHRLVICILLFSSIVSVLRSQHFSASLTGGVNASQLDGDQLRGFDKLGWHGGLRISYPRKKGEWAMELLYQQKGSTETLSFGSASELSSITLHYLSIPLLYSIGEWYDEVIERDRFRLDVGVVPNALFDVHSSNPFFDDATDDFRQFDFGLVAGLAYALSHKLSLTFRYEASIMKIYKDPISNIRGLRSYLLTFRFEYTMARL